MQRARITFSSLETNAGKLLRLVGLHRAYAQYVQECLDQMIAACKTNLYPSERRLFFTPPPTLSSQIAKNAQAHAVSLMQIWAKGLYGRTLSKRISRDTALSDQQKLELRCCGKYGIRKAGPFGKGTISQDSIDLYLSWIWDPEVVGQPPQVKPDHPMQMTEMTCTFEQAAGGHFGWWIKCSSLESRKLIQIPLASTPYLKRGLAKSVQVQPTLDGRWRFQFSEELPNQEHDGSAGKVGLDVGLNCLAATSDGRIYGRNFKPLFDKSYHRVRDLRANRQRQGFREDSTRLTRLERKLSGQIKSEAGRITNRLVEAYPKHTFVCEDLDLRGCRGQKRFAYRALQKTLATKAVCKVVNPAYTSQECPSCGHVSRNNRKGIKFACKGCGRSGHADVVGGQNLLRRSEDKQIRAGDHPSAVKRLLGMRYLRKRGSSALTDGSTLRGPSEPEPSGRGLTVGVPKGIRTASKSIPGFT